jgi:ParB/RepB/Spo0J family partition protein
MTEVAIELIDEAADNLRQEIGDVTALAASIRVAGILQPLLVSPRGEDRFQVVVGSRRLAAAKQVGLPTVPVVPRQLGARQRIAAMLIENVQRGDLTPIEEAEGYARLQTTGLTQRQIAAMVGVAQSTVSKRLGLLDFPASVQAAIHQRRLPIRIAEELHSLIEAGLRQRAEILANRICSGELLISEKRTRRIVSDELRAAGIERVRKASVRAFRQQGELVGPDAAEAADDADALAKAERLRALADQGLQPCPTCKGRGTVPLREPEWDDPP